MSQQPAEHATESYFVAQLAEHAKQSSVAAPATLPSLVENLSYLSQDELALVKSAHAYAEQAHQGQSRRTGHAYITHLRRWPKFCRTCAWIPKPSWQPYCTM